MRYVIGIGRRAGGFPKTDDFLGQRDPQALQVKVSRRRKK